MLQLALVFCFIGGIFAQTPGLGKCPSVATVAPFEVDKFFGEWYENRRSIPNFFEAESKCVKVTYSSNSTDTINVVKHRVSWITGNESDLEGTATLDVEGCKKSDSGCSKYVYKLAVPLVGDFELPYWVLDTDYNSYAVVYSCLEKFGVHAKYLWVLTREQFPSETVLSAAKGALHENGLHNVPTLAVDQRNCAQ